MSEEVLIGIMLSLMFVMVITVAYIIGHEEVEFKERQKVLKIERKERREELKNREKQDFIEYTQEEIDEIHSRNKLTVYDKVDEMKRWGVCLPGDHAGSAAWRCNIFSNCEDCILSYLKDTGVREYDSLVSDIKIHKI